MFFDFVCTNIIRIFENSETLLDLTSSTRRVELNIGAVANIIGKLREKAGVGNIRYALAAPTAVMGVRGTAFYIKVENPERTYVCCCNGVIEIEDSMGENQDTVRVKHHQAYYFTRSGENITVTDADMLYHTDKDMEDLASKVKVKIDWTKVGD